MPFDVVAKIRYLTIVVRYKNYRCKDIKSSLTLGIMLPFISEYFIVLLPVYIPLKIQTTYKMFNLQFYIEFET
jgi:hypothetical protein